MDPADARAEEETSIGPLAHRDRPARSCSRSRSPRASRRSWCSRSSSRPDRCSRPSSIGNRVLAEKLSYRFFATAAYGDIVVFDDPDEPAPAAHQARHRDRRPDRRRQGRHGLRRRQAARRALHLRQAERPLGTAIQLPVHGPRGLRVADGRQPHQQRRQPRLRTRAAWRRSRATPSGPTGRSSEFGALK